MDQARSSTIRQRHDQLRQQPRGGRILVTPDRSLTAGAPDPTGPAVTRRVLSRMLAEEP